MVGRTAVVVYMDQKKVVVASVGDSRAVMAVLPSQESEEKKGKKDRQVEERKLGRFRRTLRSSRLLDSIQLTVDQKPNHHEEKQRIIKAGGRVIRLKDEYGSPIGPYRIWKQDGHLPGLAMSRSIGDEVAKELGVIATPIVLEFEPAPGFDQFLIIASDGLWDVMSNSEATSFVDRFRHLCPIESSPSSSSPVSASNACISHLLCEEARYRWFGIVEQDDVMVDDISCLVIQLYSGAGHTLYAPERRFSRVIHTLGDLEDSPGLAPKSRRDTPLDLLRKKDSSVVSE